MEIGANGHNGDNVPAHVAMDFKLALVLVPTHLQNMVEKIALENRGKHVLAIRRLAQVKMDFAFSRVIGAKCSVIEWHKIFSSIFGNLR